MPSGLTITSVALNLFLALALGMAGFVKLSPALDADTHKVMLAAAPVYMNIWGAVLKPIGISGPQFVTLIGCLEVGAAVLRVAGLVIKGLGLSRFGGLIHTAVMCGAVFTHIQLNDVATKGVPSVVLCALCIIQLLLAARLAQRKAQRKTE